jgi:hypothetical protein
MTMKKKLALRLLMLSCLAALPLAFINQTAMAQDDTIQVYDVTITNLTGGVVVDNNAPAGQIFSEPVVATHDNQLAPLFTLGSPASIALYTIAEDAFTSDLLNLWEPTTNADVFALKASSQKVFPGDSQTIEISGGGKYRLISLVAMLVTTNDSFFALNGVPLPTHGSITYYSPAYDAGSEVNDEDCAHIPGPPCGNHVRMTTGAEGYGYVHAGIHGSSDLDPRQFDWRNPVAEITITKVTD